MRPLRKRMRRRPLFVGSLLLAASVLLALPWLAWREARQQAYAAEAEWGLTLGRAMVHRIDLTMQQSLDSIAYLSRFRDTPCSADALASMKQFALSSTYIKAVGYVSENRLTCSSMGSEPLALGNHVLKTRKGLRIYSDLRLPMDAASSLMAVERDGFAALFDSKLPIDVGTAIQGMSRAILHLERRPEERPAMATGYVDRRWTARLGNRHEVTFTDGAYLVTVVRAAQTPAAAIAALPLSRVVARRDAIAWRYVPASMVLGMVIAAAIALLARRQASLATALRRAVRNGEFFLVYQPVVELRSGRPVGVEALLRWRRPDGTLIGPDLFIPLAEEIGVITQLTELVFVMVEQDTRDFLAGHPDFHVALNLSAQDLQSDAILGLVDALLARGSAKASNLVVEITERGILDFETARPIIEALRARGIAIAIDDFGTGYAGLSYLESLPVDMLKIDKSFIDGIGTSAPTNEVVNHIITMAAAMRLTVIGEGVETAAQANYLDARGVQLAQGWRFGKPQRFADAVSTMVGPARQRA
jgi:sensor c-di-GMP phosphodiesterase-like protein